MSTAADLLVVGAGPAGTAAAITAAGHGARVVVVDRARFPRDKTCGDGLTSAALRLLDALGVDAPGIDGYQRVTETVVVSPSGRTVPLPLPSDGHRAAVIRRADLDAALVARARAAGAEVREGDELTELVTDAHGVKARVRTGAVVEAPTLVAADGHWSSVRRLLAPTAGRDLGEWHAVRQYFTGVVDRRLWVIFEPDLLPGYAWVFPLPGGGANAGYGVLRGAGRAGAELRGLWPDLLGRPALRRALGSRAEPAGPVRAWPIPTRYDPSRLATGPVLFAGDAAGVVDPMTGEGIAQALETGMLAARAASQPDPAASYTAAVGRALGTDLRFAAALQQLLRHPLGARGAVRAAGLTAWTRRNFARWLWEDYPRALVLTPRRWRRGAFAPAPARFDLRRAPVGAEPPPASSGAE